MAVLSPVAKQQFFDNDGNPAAGYLLYTYATGTSTPLATYSDKAGLVANTNPIVLDARGEATIYLDPSSTYDYTLKTGAGATVWTREGVSAAAGEADAVSFLQAGAGAVSRTIQEKARETVSLLDFVPVAEHAAIQDGTTTYDCTADIQKALDHLATVDVPVTGSGGGGRGSLVELRLPPGVLNITGQIENKSSYTRIVGEDTIISPDASFTDTYAFFAGTNAWRMEFVGVQFQDFDTAVYLNSDNVNSGRIIFKRCGFFNNTLAVHLVTRSSVITFDDCMWRSNVRELLIEEGDWTIVRGGWVSRGTLVDDYDGGFVVQSTRAMLIMDGLCGVPAAQTVAEPAWIKNYGSVLLRGVRFGGETGQHAVVNNMTAGSNTSSDAKNAVTMEDCAVYTGADPSVRLFAIPNLVSITGNKGMTGTGSVLVDWSSTIDAGEQATAIAAITLVNSVRHLIYLRANVLASTPMVPANLLPITNSDTHILLANHDVTEPRAIVFDVRQAAISAGEVYGQIDWYGRDASAGASGLRAQVRADAASTVGAAALVFACAATAQPIADVAQLTSAGWEPVVDATAFLGSATNRWNRLYASAGLYTGAGVKVVGTQQTAVADAVGGDEVAKINAILARLRAHGLIAT